MSLFNRITMENCMGKHKKNLDIIVFQKRKSEGFPTDIFLTELSSTATWNYI